jgi:hypothetical protein
MGQIGIRALSFAIVKTQSTGAGRGRRGGDRRASREAVEKRRAARLFNEILLGRGPHEGVLDGRTERRRKRLLRELADAASGKRQLKPIDVLSRVQSLLELGEPLTSIRKAYPPRRAVEPTADVVDGVKRIHQAYGFATEAYRFVGLDDAVLRKAGVLGRKAAVPARGPGPRSTRAAARRPGLAAAEPRPGAASRRGVA